VLGLHARWLKSPFSACISFNSAHVVSFFLCFFAGGVLLSSSSSSTSMSESDEASAGPAMVRAVTACFCGSTGFRTLTAAASSTGHSCTGLCENSLLPLLLLMEYVLLHRTFPICHEHSHNTMVIMCMYVCDNLG
jgi:hypothetical protein